MTASGEERADGRADGIRHRRSRVTRHGRVGSLAEAAAARGVEPRDIVKTLVVRRAEDDFLFVLVPGDREISWPKLRAHLGVNRVSMPDAATALEVTGYERGTITPFGSSTAWPVVADATMTGRTVSMGAGAHGVAATVAADDVVRRARRRRRRRHRPRLTWPSVARSTSGPWCCPSSSGAGRRRWRPPVVLLPGTGLTARSWDAVAASAVGHPHRARRRPARARAERVARASTRSP